MRKCTIIPKVWQPEKRDGSSIQKGEWVPGPMSDGFFHQFVTETSDGEQCAMAIVEYQNGSVATVPLSWVILQPEEPMIACVGEIASMELLPKEATDRLVSALDDFVSQLNGISQEIMHFIRMR